MKLLICNRICRKNKQTLLENDNESREYIEKLLIDHYYKVTSKYIINFKYYNELYKNYDTKFIIDGITKDIVEILIDYFDKVLLKLIIEKLSSLSIHDFYLVATESFDVILSAIFSKCLRNWKSLPILHRSVGYDRANFFLNSKRFDKGIEK